MTDKIAAVCLAIGVSATLASIWDASWQWGATAGLFWFLTFAAWLYPNS